VYRDPKKHQIPEQQLAKSKLCPKKKGKVAIINHDWLTSEYQQVMMAGLFQASNMASVDKLRILHLGTGAGVLPMFLKSQMASLNLVEKLVTIENNQDMITVAKNYFGFDPDGEILESLQDDGYEYVMKNYVVSNLKMDKPYHMIFMDINYSSDDVTISPPKKFLAPDFLQALCSMAHPECAYIAINV